MVAYGSVCSNGSKTLTPSNSSPQVTTSGLTAGKTYTCVVKATNSRGTGPVSSPTPAVKA